MTMGVLKGLLVLIVLLPVVVLAAGWLGLLQGQAPTDLGVRDGRLKPPSATRNSVSSQAALYSESPGRAYAQIDPLPLRGDGVATNARLRLIAEAMPGARVVKSEPGYLYLQFTTRWLRFVDDTELWFDPAAGVVQLRSASRLGKEDFGVNRARVEALRAALAAP
jgi:uncharacterized protein (DUF1499 family)